MLTILVTLTQLSSYNFFWHIGGAQPIEFNNAQWATSITITKGNYYDT